MTQFARFTFLTLALASDIPGIFYKFALDEHKLYGDSVERAMKAAGHEIKGLTCLLDWELKTVGLHAIKWPLMVLIDHRGYRLIAMSMLPLGKSTLCYGSDDAGRTLKLPKKDRPSTIQLHELIGRWCRYLNLREHTVLTADGTPVKIFSPFDLEGHIGTDGNLYWSSFSHFTYYG